MLVFGSYAFTVPIISTVHELGHIIAYLSVGFTDFRLIINPLGMSQAEPLMPLPGEHMLYLASAGMVFQLLVFAVTGFVLRNSLSPLFFPVKMCLPISLFNVGSYLLATGIEDGDSAIMVANGASGLILNVIGFGAVLAGLFYFVRLLPEIGFSSRESIIEVFSPIFLGMGTYSVLMLGYAVLTGSVLWIGLINIVSGVFFALVVALAFKRCDIESMFSVSLVDSFRVLVLGFFVVALSLVIL
jgi:hypothetical protein